MTHRLDRRAKSLRWLGAFEAETLMRWVRAELIRALGATLPNERPDTYRQPTLCVARLHRCKRGRVIHNLVRRPGPLTRLRAR